MATYEKLSWETIELPVVTGDTYFIVYDHSSSTPGDDQTGIIYSGLVLDGYSIIGIDEILSQYVYPQDVSFTASGHVQVDSTMYKTFYVYYTNDDWDTYTYDTITITYDWSYSTAAKSTLSDPINNLIDSRQIFMWSKKPSTPDISTTITVNVDGIQQDQFTITGYNTYNYITPLTGFLFAGEFTYAYSYDFFVDSSTPTGEFSKITIGGMTYYVTLTCNRYCLYYLNQIGGWDSLLFNGRELQTDKLSRLSYKKNYRAMTTDFHKVDYLTTISEAWSLNTSYLDDIQSSKMINVLASNRIYLHDLEQNIIIPVNIVNSSCEHKTYKNQGRKMAVYTLEVEASQEKYRV